MKKWGIFLCHIYKWWYYYWKEKNSMFLDILVARCDTLFGQRGKDTLNCHFPTLTWYVTFLSVTPLRGRGNSIFFIHFDHVTRHVTWPTWQGHAKCRLYPCLMCYFPLPPHINPIYLTMLARVGQVKKRGISNILCAWTYKLWITPNR